MRHPQFGAQYCLDEDFCSWKSNSWYSTERGKNAVRKIVSQATERTARYVLETLSFIYIDIFVYRSQMNISHEPAEKTARYVL